MLALIALLGLAVYLAPLWPVALRYGALPRTPDRTRTYLVAGVTPKYAGYHTRAPEDYRGLADTLLLVQVRAGERKLKVLNIPRDTWTQIPDWGMGKINSANVRGGPQGLIQAVEHLTGVPIDGYVLLSLAALRDVTDAAGGVTLDVARPMHYTDHAAGLFIDLEAGRQHLSGPQAEAYVRFRHDGMGDIGRVTRQQDFVHALSARLLSFPGVLYAPRVAGALVRDTRSDLSREEVASLLGALLRRPALETTLLPGGFGPGGTWQPDQAGIRDLVQAQFARERLPGDPRGLRVALINVNAPSGSARRLKSKLEALGYTHVVVGNGAGSSAQTVVLAADRRAAERLRGDLGYGAVELTSDARPDADLTVRLGADTPQR